MNVFQALDMGKRALAFENIRKNRPEIPLLFALASTQCATEMVLSVVALGLFVRFFKEE